MLDTTSRQTRRARPGPALALGAAILQAACGGGSSGQAEAKTADSATQPAPAAGAVRAVDWAAVDAAMGRTGAEQPGNVRRYGMPRGDMRVTVQGVQVKPALALGSWLAMTPHGDGVMAMGDMVLKESELAPVMSALQAGGVQQTAVHHHLLHETPRVVYMHVHAMGDPVKIAQTVRGALERTSTPAAAPGAAAPAAEPLGIDTAGIARTLGHTGRVNGGVYQVNAPRPETIRDSDMVVPGSMGLGTVMNFQPTGGGKAAITGDFVLRASEVNPVIRALRAANIEVTSLHNHMLNDEPRLFFMHFWANDDAVTLARGLRAALDSTAQRAR
jgi:hypothetical protein